MEPGQMKILILGGNGMAGHTIAMYFSEKGHDVTIFSREPSRLFKSFVGDALDYQLLGLHIIESKYDAIINAIGILNESAEKNKPEAILLNSFLPHYLSKLLIDSQTKLIHMSTDCVFSGKVGGYFEHSIKDGASFYDKTKALGELDNNKDVTFRTSIIGPDINIEGIGLFNWFMKQKGQVKGYTNSIWTGVTTITLAKAMEKAIIHNLSGIYHLVNNDKISKNDLLLLFQKYARSQVTRVIPYDNERVDKSLINSRSDFDFLVPSYDEMVIEMIEWIEKHRYIYNHYFEGIV